MARTIVLGVGNRLGGDDAVGSLLVNMLNQALRPPGGGRQRTKAVWPDITAIDAGTAPESYTSVIRRSRPDLLILVDAADMGLPPGALRIIPPGKISVLSFSTHSMPLSMFISYVEEFCGKVLLVGVQPERTEIGGRVSEAVRKSAKELARLIVEGGVAQIAVLQ